MPSRSPSRLREAASGGTYRQQKRGQRAAGANFETTLWIPVHRQHARLRAHLLDRARSTG
jgi:hypothetical protein